LIDRKSWSQQSDNPFDFDIKVSQHISQDYDVVHFNGNPWRETLKTLRYFNPEIKVVSSVPAHNLKKSIFEHKKLGIRHNELYPHLHRWGLWKKYIEHINESDIVITPSNMSRDRLLDLPFIREDIRVEVIPHGINIPQEIPPYPEKITPAYFGSAGPDKGTHFLPNNVKKFGRAFGNDYEDLYDLMSQVTFGVFPSVTEAFNICALECVAYGREVLISKNAGFYEYIQPRCYSYDDDLTKKQLHDYVKTLSNDEYLNSDSENLIEFAKDFSWDKIEEKYVELYTSI